MPFEYGLIENALHSLSEAMNYYHEGDDDKNATKYKFSILLSAHCAELLLKEVLRRSHPALVLENIDQVSNIYNDDNQTIGYKAAVQRVKTLCGVNLLQYESYLDELGKTRNAIQHYKYSIDGNYHKELMARSFSAIEFLFRDVLNLRFEDYESIIDKRDVDFLHEDATDYQARIADIRKEFAKNVTRKFVLMYSETGSFEVVCPICGTQTLAQEETIRCKMCGAEFEDYCQLHKADQSCHTSSRVLRELGRRKKILESPLYECPHCEHDTLVHISHDRWSCLICGYEVDGSTNCGECGSEMPNSNEVYYVAMSDYDTDDYSMLCQECASLAREDENYIGYEISRKPIKE